MEISAAVVRSFDHPPRYESFDLPAPADEDELTGPMATRTVVDARRCIPLPDGVDVIKVAAAMKAYLEELPPLVEEIDHGGIAVTARAHPLADVESVWTAPEVPGVRTVLVTGRSESQARPGTGLPHNSE